VTKRLFGWSQRFDMTGLQHETSPARLGEVEAFHNTCAWDFMPSNHLFD
jgi:hypothetical protein